VLADSYRLGVFEVEIQIVVLADSYRLSVFEVRATNCSAC